MRKWNRLCAAICAAALMASPAAAVYAGPGQGALTGAGLRFTENLPAGPLGPAKVEPESQAAAEPEETQTVPSGPLANAQTQETAAQTQGAAPLLGPEAPAGSQTAESETAAPTGPLGPGAGTQEAFGLPREFTEEEVDAYFDNTVLIGDSIMLGFRNYAMRRQNTWLSRVQFLPAGSYSTINALKPVSSTSIHPVYAGQQRPIWESIAMMGAKKVFMCFGMNDLNLIGIEGTCENYKKIVANIKALSPDAEIHLISMTYTLKDKGKKQLRNDNIRLFNEALRQLAAENGWGFVNLAPRLADENGDLALPYCSDNFIHQTPAAYDVWCTVLREYAQEQLRAALQEQPQAVEAQTPAGPRGPLAP